MIFQSLCGFLPFLDAINHWVTDLHSSIAFEGPGYYSGQYINGVNSHSDEAKYTCVVVEDDDALGGGWQLWTLDLLDTSHVHVDLVFPCACRTHGTLSASAVSSSRPSWSSERSHTKATILSSRRRLVAAAAQHEECLMTYTVVVGTLQVFLRLTRANVTTLFLPMLAHATGCGGGGAAARIGDAVLAVVSTCGVLGSAVAARQLGRDAMCAISGVLIVFCQVAGPAMVAAQAGLSLSGGGGGTRRTGAAAAGMFAAACGVSGGVGWAWGALFWAVPGPGEGGIRIRSVGQAALGFGLGFAQMQCFLLTLRQLKHAAFAYYAVWIWS